MISTSLSNSEAAAWSRACARPNAFGFVRLDVAASHALAHVFEAREAAAAARAKAPVPRAGKGVR